MRPVPLDIHIMGFDIVNFDARLRAMYKPMYNALVAASNQVAAGGIIRFDLGGSLLLLVPAAQT